jgi:elongation factor Ts
MPVDPEKVKKLREMTDLPMMDCKRALDKTDGDIDKAFDELRKGGLKAQEKLAGRAANEGKIGGFVSPDGKMGVLVALRCETEPVGKNENFQRFLKEVVEVVAKTNPKDRAALEAAQLASGKTVAQGLTELVNLIRENITLGRFARFESDAVVQYIHFDGKKAGMVALQGAPVSNPKVAEVGKELGMQIVFSPPASLDRAGLDPAIVAKEREVFLARVKNDPKNSSKPPQILDKIVEGQLNEFVASKSLLDQVSIRDSKQTVTQFVKSSGAGVSVKAFAYVATDIEK